MRECRSQPSPAVQPVAQAAAFASGSKFARRGVRRAAIPAGIIAVLLAVVGLGAQTPDRITQPIDLSCVQALKNHHPLWANAANDAGASALRPIP